MPSKVCNKVSKQKYSWLIEKVFATVCSGVLEIFIFQIVYLLLTIFLYIIDLLTSSHYLHTVCACVCQLCKTSEGHPVGLDQISESNLITVQLIVDDMRLIIRISKRSGYCLAKFAGRKSRSFGCLRCC